MLQHPRLLVVGPLRDLETLISGRNNLLAKLLGLSPAVRKDRKSDLGSSNTLMSTCRG